MVLGVTGVDDELDEAETSTPMGGRCPFDADDDDEVELKRGLEGVPCWDHPTGDRKSAIDIGRPLLPVEEDAFTPPPPPKSMLDLTPPPPPPLSLKLPNPSLANDDDDDGDSRSMLPLGELVEGNRSFAFGTILEAAFLAVVAPRPVRDLRKFHSPSKVTSPNSSSMDW